MRDAWSRWKARLLCRAPEPVPEPARDACALRADALPAGTTLGGVTVARPAGRGATAVVYAGVDAATGEPRALKVWCPREGTADARADAAARERFLGEARHAARLMHPGIVRVLDGGSERGLTFIVSEWFAGTPLAHWTSPAHRLPEPVVLDIAAQLAEALAHAHRQGVVHRDVKPSNALYDPATHRAALTDFGLARAPDAQASRSGMMLGSPAYMAPELLAGQAADAPSDLYALGVLTWELLAGRPPFEATSIGALLRAVAREAPPPLASVRPDWPAATAAALDALIAPLLRKEPEQRPADALAWAAQARAAAGALGQPG
jgi:serine/threonine-protein kinase